MEDKFSISATSSTCNEIIVSNSNVITGTTSNESNSNEVSDPVKCVGEQPKFDSDIGEFYFESDAVPLKTNNDYKMMLKAMAKLESQRIQAIRDLDCLRETRDEALADPIRFVERLQKGENLNLPHPQKVTPLPYIDWKIYRLNCGTTTLLNKQIASRNWTRGFGPDDEDNDSRDGSPRAQGDKPNIVRGKLMTEFKSSTFNKLWTAEEQKKLEELLIKYPPEEFESKRWSKIANELGNRTPQQVQSRVQKFFIKLSKAGLPVPGRTPPFSAIRRAGLTIRKPGRPTRYFYQYASSSFNKHNIPPVYMDESNQSDEPSYYHASPSTPNSSDDRQNEDENHNNDHEGLKDDPEAEELRFLLRLKEQRLRQKGLAQHIGYKCDRCGCNPIVGTRWHCVDCPATQSTDFCDDCVDCQHESECHTADHTVEAWDKSENSKPFLDRDYTHFMGGDYNYLDPNYMPATT